MAKSLVIVGAGMGGLSAAIHARLAGFDVLVLEKGDKAGGKAAGIDLAGYQLDPGPSILILLRVYRELFAAAGRKMEDYLRFRRLPVISRVTMEGDDPIDLPADEALCLDLLRQINPSDAEAMERLMDKVSKVEPLLWDSVFAHEFHNPIQLLDPKLMKFGMTLDATKPFKVLVDSMFQSPVLRAFFYGFPSYGGQSYRSPSPGSFLIPYFMLRDGVYVAEGGVRAIPAALTQLALELGVEIRFGAEATDVETDSTVVRSLRLSNGEAVTADHFIVNRDRFTFAKLLGRKVDAEPSYSYFTLHWGINREFPGMQHHNLFVPRDYETGFEELYRGEFPQRPIVYVNSTSHEDPAGSPAGRSNLFAVVTSPSRGRDGFDEASARQRVMAELQQFGLTWDAGEQDFERLQSPLYFEQTHGNYRGSLYGLDESQRLWGMFPSSTRDGKLKNLAYCGGSVQPGAGLPMVTLSGKFAVSSLT